ncbi:MAG TPA: hypothetical protein VKT72_08480, partial [Candidatus Baltobacteraceae bacterium]|nr:hypothetical protein [Candidatus Baltobacteraceae bacterium]
MRISSIRREIRLLRLYALGSTVLAGVFLLGAVHEASQNATFDTLTVHQIKVMDREGKLAMIITDHDDFPPPIINGKALHRMGGADSNGIVFYNQLGNEQGALDWAGRVHPDGSYDSASTLSYDSVTTDQMLQLDDGNDNGKTSAYMIGWNEPNYNTPMFQAALAEIQAAKTQAQRLAVLKKYPGIRSATRFLFGYDESNT